MRCANTSVSVSLLNTCPRSSSDARSSAKFSMMPLWTTAMRPSQLTWGWAFSTVGRRGSPARMADPARRESSDRTVARRCELVLKTGDLARAADDVERRTAVPRVGSACGIRRRCDGARRFHEGQGPADHIRGTRDV